MKKILNALFLTIMMFLLLMISMEEETAKDLP